MRLVIDTNVLVSALSSRSKYHWLVQQLLAGKFIFFITDEIILEYEEVLSQKYTLEVAKEFLIAMQALQTVYFTKVYFHWKLLADEDDNKFVDCAIAANADYLITNDKDFNILKQINFPKVNVVTIQDFEKERTF